MISAANLTIVVGLILLAIEIWALGMSTIVLLTMGIGFIVVGLLAHFEWFPTTLPWLVSLSVFVGAILLVILWKPLKKWQQPTEKATNQHSDFIGLTFILESPLSHQSPVYVRYSGIRWRLVLSAQEAQASYPIGTMVKVVGVDVGQFTVIAQQD